VVQNSPFTDRTEIYEKLLYVIVGEFFELLIQKASGYFDGRIPETPA